MANLVASTLMKVANWIGGSQVQKRSAGERLIVSLLPQTIGARSSFSWSSDRIELANHYRGWSYISVHAIASELAGIFPQMALRRDGEELVSKRLDVMFAKSFADKKKALLAYHQTRRKYLSPTQRRKVLAQTQEHEELEPVGPGHKLLKLLGKPNPIDTWWTFAYKLGMFLQIHGSIYILKIFNGYNEISELWVLPPQWMWPIASKDSFAAEYEIRPIAGYSPIEGGLGWFVGGAGTTRVKGDHVICIQYPNPQNYFDGQSPMLAAANWTQCSESVDESRTAAFHNEMLPGVILLIDKEVADPPKEQRDALKQRIIDEYAGVRKSRQPVILGPGITLAPDQRNTPVEMDHFNSADQLKTYIMAAQKVGPSQVGMTEEVTFAGAIAAKANFHQCTIRPILLLIGEALTRHLVEPHYEENGLLYWKDATPEDPEYVLKKWDTAVKNGSATWDEFRQHALGLEAYPFGGDNPVLPMGMSPMNVQEQEPDYDDARVTALDAKQNEQKDEEADAKQTAAQGGLERGEAALNGKPNGDRAALGEQPQASDGDKASAALARARAAKRLRLSMIHRNGVLK